MRGTQQHCPRHRDSVATCIFVGVLDTQFKVVRCHCIYKKNHCSHVRRHGQGVGILVKSLVLAMIPW